MVFGHIFEDTMESADTKRVMKRYGNCMGCAVNNGFEPYMAPCLVNW